MGESLAQQPGGAAASVTTPRSRLRILFMGSGRIAVPALAALLACPQIEVVGIATQPDRPQGRKRVLLPTPVGAWCQRHGVPVQQPGSVNRPEFVQWLATLELDLIVVFAFGQLLKEPLLKLPKWGCVNLHASLLPAYRGASPVTAAILHGERQTGISVMQMAVALDAGAVYARYPLPLSGAEYAPEVEERLAALAAERIGEALQQISRGELIAHPQDEGAATFAPRLTKADGQLQWAQPAARLARQVRAYFPWPGAWFTVDTTHGPCRIAVTAATVIPGMATAPPGHFLQCDDEAWIVACGQDALRLDRLIPEGRKEMSAAEYLRGRPLSKGISA
jgi:methionyl-tRNA formyltransferase